jgi:hypothetical protein
LYIAKIMHQSCNTLKKICNNINTSNSNIAKRPEYSPYQNHDLSQYCKYIYNIDNLYNIQEQSSTPQNTPVEFIEKNEDISNNDCNWYGFYVYIE